MPLCSKACLKSYWTKHKRVCEKKKPATVTDSLADELASLKLEQRSLWLKIKEPEQQLIAEYMDVHNLCRTDSAMTRVDEEKD